MVVLWNKQKGGGVFIYFMNTGKSVFSGNYQVGLQNYLWHDILLVYHQTWWLYQIPDWSGIFTEAEIRTCTDRVIICRLRWIVPHLLWAPCWRLHQLQRGSDARQPWALRAISQHLLASPVCRPRWGLPSVSQILPQVFRSQQITVPELQPETSPAQWVQFGWWILKKVCMSWKDLLASVTCLHSFMVITCDCSYRRHLCSRMPCRLLRGWIRADVWTVPRLLSVLHWKEQPRVPRL